MMWCVCVGVVPRADRVSAVLRAWSVLHITVGCVVCVLCVWVVFCVIYFKNLHRITVRALSFGCVMCVQQ